MTTELAEKSDLKKFFCEHCDYNAHKKSDWLRHLSTSKHKNTTNYNILAQENAHEIENKKYNCECGKLYNHRASLFNHKKKCTFSHYPSENIILDASSNEIIILTNLVFEMVKSNTELQKQNHELQKQVLDVCQKIQPIMTNNNNTVNSHNKTFNLQFFLNEQCKDAMNIMDFVNTFQLQFSDLEKIGEVGYVEGISNIIIDKLNEMDIYKRPIHCSDAKREIMHIKDNDVWEKDNANNDKLRLAIKYITKKNTDMINPWAEEHPGVRDSDHRLNDKYQEMIIEAMGGNSGTIRECETKIIKKISKMVLIDKKPF